MIVMEKKRISVSDKRQITIPIEFFNELNIGKQVDCIMEGNSIIIMPVNTEDSYFAEEILKDLISKGLSGQELLNEFRNQNKKINKALSKYLEEVDKDLKENKLLTSKDVFGKKLKGE